MASEKQDQIGQSAEQNQHLPRSSIATEKTITSTMGTQTGNMNANPQHTLFCRMVGIPLDFETTPYPSMWNLFSRKDKKYKGLYPRVRVAFQWHTLQYWLVATLTNSLLMLQICLGAALTGLGGTKTDRVSIAIIVLGALQSVFAGFLTYFKSRNQPNRAHQFRNSLGNVLDAIENAENLLRDPDYKIPPYTPSQVNAGANSVRGQESWVSGAAGITVTGVEGLVLRLMDMYCDAVREAEANYPDFWQSTTRSDQSDENATMRDMLEVMKRNGSLQVNGTTGTTTGTTGTTTGTTGTTTGTTGTTATGTAGASSSVV